MIPLVILLAAVVIYGIYAVLRFYTHYRENTATGTIEAEEVNLGVVMGGITRDVFVSEGEPIVQNQVLASVKGVSGVTPDYTEKVRSPMDGIVLTRAIEPGEVALAGSTLFVVADLYTVTLTVYVPEDRYGQVMLGQNYPVTVDSFPGQIFSGKVTHIADKAEYTPRNVQTVESRKNTVYAVKLVIPNPDLLLKPGMPADVDMGER